MSIYKVSKGTILEMKENIDYIDCKSYIIDVRTNKNISYTAFDKVLFEEDFCLYTTNKNLAVQYKQKIGLL